MKKNEKIEKLLGEIDKALGDTNKSAEVFYLLKKQGKISARQREAIIKLQQEILRITKDYLKKYAELFYFLQDERKISHLKQADLVELEKKILENQLGTKENILKLIEIAKALKVTLPKTFDVKVVNSDDFPTELKISNLNEIPSPPDEVHIKQPLWLPDLFNSLIEFVIQPLIRTIQKQVQNVNLTGPTDPKKAIAVRLSDGKRFYTAILQAIAAGAESLDTVESLLQQILSGLGATPTLANRYIVTTNEINTGTGEVDICIVKNPSASGKTVRIEQVLISSQDVGQRTFRLYRSATISANGASLLINGMQTSQDPSIASAFKSPTITSKGSLIFGGNFGEGSPLQSLSVPFVILPNENLLVTSQSTSDRIFLSLVWIEE